MPTSRLGSSTLIASLITLTGVFSSPAHAAISNGGFEAGFSSWTTTGNTSIQTSVYGSGPIAGTKQALVSTADTEVFSSDLETFLGIATGSLDGIDNGETTQGSAIQQAFTANAGQVLTFNWNFLTDEATPPEFFNDFSFVTIGSLSKLADTSATFVSSLTPFNQETGFQSFFYTIPTTGTYSLGIGVTNAGDFFGDSGLLIDNVALSTIPVPEPNSAWGTLVIGVLGIGSLLKRRR